MGMEDQERLDQLIRESFPRVEVSPDFTLRLWHRLMKQPVRPPWLLPVPVLSLAVAMGIVSGLWTWNRSPLADSIRWDLFGNAPLDSLAGATLRLL